MQALLDRFITVAVAASESPENGLDRIAGGMSLIAAVTATIQLQLFPPEAQVLGKTRDRVPLLVVAASVAFEEAESRRHKVVALRLLRLLRLPLLLTFLVCFFSSRYNAIPLAM